MKTSRAFADHCLDLFSGLGPVAARAMFGGFGFYQGQAMFAIGDAEEWRVWLKVDEETRGRFAAAGGEPFLYTGKAGRTTTLSFVTPPEGTMEDGEAMLAWARLALQAAERALARRRPRRLAGSRRPEARPAGKPRASRRRRATRR